MFDQTANWRGSLWISISRKPQGRKVDGQDRPAARSAFNAQANYFIAS
jgi:hypothetical protein